MNFATKAAAQYLTDNGLPTAGATLVKKRSVGGGPKYRKATNGRVTYAQADLDQFIADESIVVADAEDARRQGIHYPAAVAKILRPICRKGSGGRCS